MVLHRLFSAFDSFDVYYLIFHVVFFLCFQECPNGHRYVITEVKIDKNVTLLLILTITYYIDIVFAICSVEGQSSTTLVQIVGHQLVVWVSWQR